MTNSPRNRCGRVLELTQQSIFRCQGLNPFTRANSGSPPWPAAVYRRHEREKIRAYEQWSFPPLVLSATGGMAPLATKFYHRLSEKLAEKWECHFSKALCLVRCKLAFSLLRASIHCLRGFRSASHRPARPALLDHADMVLSEARIEGSHACWTWLTFSKLFFSPIFPVSPLPFIHRINHCDVCIVHGDTLLLPVRGL